MKIKERLLFLSVVCFSILCIIGALRYRHKNNELSKQINDLSIQLAHSIIPLQLDTIHDTIHVTTQKVIEVDKTDYKKELADKQLIKDLGLKVDQLVSENKMLRETRDSVKLKPVSDSVLVYHDYWADFEYLAKRQLLKYSVRDSFVTNVSRIYKHRFLWWHWGTKGYQVKHINFNPNVAIKYNQYIILKD